MAKDKAHQLDWRGMELLIDEINGSAPSTPGNATTTTEGVVKQAAAQPDSTATDAAGVVADFNALLAKLRTAGILAT